MTLQAKQSIKSRFIQYVLPSVAAMWVYTIYTMADGIFVARGVGEQALAAVNDLMRAYKMLDLKLNDTLLNNIMILGLQHAVYPLEQDADTEKWEIP